MKFANYISKYVAIFILASIVVCEEDDDDEMNYKYDCGEEQNSNNMNSCSIQGMMHHKDKYEVFVIESSNNYFIRQYFEQNQQTWNIIKKSTQSSSLDLVIINENIDWKIVNDHVIISVWPLSNQFYNKANFYKNAEKLHRSGKIGELSINDVMPLTYFIDMNLPKFSDEEKEFFRVHKSGVWIKKPVEDHRCKGIEVFDDLKQFQLKVGKNKPFKKQNYPQDKKSWIVQKYIENSLLIEGRKFDVRCFVLVASFDPYVLLYHPGYVRRSLEQFSLQDLSNKFIHCVNQSVQMKHKNYQQRKLETIWTYEHFENWLKQNNQNPLQIEENMKKRLAYSALGQKEFVTTGKRQLHINKFQLFGADVSFDDKYTPYVIEFNEEVYLGQYHIPDLDVIFKQVVKSMLQIEQNHMKYHKIPHYYFSSPQFLEDMGKFQILYNEATNYSIIQ
ncbi:tubulin-tyrosine ligase family protein (macronuclear) [Tetrahymena thermophila SB210]|uniref:Tubulin-tyrosine ligase family protein n=1 Tax=Tetrahymena thermophila (strain SB210) TaxID=312017 RepID=Q23KD7_TETTS|nr:tubulin-tyrosine ligase family protein [Tetrahymena thermophila SB210]EAR96906.2 tubulin-tyrosine ligase family protein [Tetrahymena thermophila SB210]|eukprot:XP_001017151.2 tubulin-tyrosine ligase family protein [Tetrahymena thermophila SB210]